MNDELIIFYQSTIGRVLSSDNILIKTDEYLNLYEFFNTKYDVTIVMILNDNNTINILDNTHTNVNKRKLILNYKQTMQHIIHTLCIASFDINTDDGTTIVTDTNPPHESKL